MPDATPVTWRACATSPGQQYDLLLLDLDGVVYVGTQAVPAAVENLNQARDRGLRCGYVTNNASRPPPVVAQHLRDLGLAVGVDDVVTSAQEGAELLADIRRGRPGARGRRARRRGCAGRSRPDPGGPVGERVSRRAPGLRSGGGLARPRRGVVRSDRRSHLGRDQPGPDRAHSAGHGPRERSADRGGPRTTGVDPAVTGKPGRGLFDLAVRRCGGEHPLVVGDRLDTDIAGAVNAGLDSLLVLTGVTDVAAVLSARPGERPAYVARDLSGLWSPHPGVDLDDGWWVCGRARARVAGGRLELNGSRTPI